MESNFITDDSLSGLRKTIIYQNYVTAEDNNSFENSLKRQAKALANNERKNQNEWFEKYYNAIGAQRLILGGRIQANIGTKNLGTTLMNCYGWDPKGANLKDPDSINGIYEALKQQAKTLASEGGYGFNCSFIRPEGSFINGINVATPGPLKFLELWNKSSEIVTSGTSKIEHLSKKEKKKLKKKIRKGAQMCTMMVWHPDIFDFIKAKQESNRFDKFNFSIGITEGFMKAVINNENWDLIFPDYNIPEYKTEWDGNIKKWELKKYPVKVYKTIKAKELWDAIMYYTYNYNDPGVLFFDVINKYNPVSYIDTLNTTNPCLYKDTLLLDNDRLVPINSDKNTKTWKSWKTGTKETIKITTNAGHEIILTPDHNIMLESGLFIEAKDSLNKAIKWITGNRIANNIINDFVLLGFLFGDGYLCGDKYGVSVKLNTEKEKEVSTLLEQYKFHVQKNGTFYINKNELPFNVDFLQNNVTNRNIPSYIMTADSNTVASFLRGLFEANGSVNSHSQISLKATNKKLVQDIQILLASFGIKSWIVKNNAKTIEWPNGTYTSEVSYNLQIVPRNSNLFKNKIGFLSHYKTIKIKKFSKQYNKKLIVASIEKNGNKEVWDFSMKNETSFNFANGIVAHNCGEIPLSTGVCNLASLNLIKYIKKNNQELELNYLEFDYDLFIKDIEIAIRVLDNVIDLTKLPLSIYEKSNKQYRRLGLGIMGLGSMFMMLGVKYGSKESIRLLKRILEVKLTTELITSAKLGKEKGSFEAFNPNQYYNTEYWKSLPLNEDIKNYIESFRAMRNATHSSIAPNGNTSIIAGLVSGGIEPVFMKEYIRWVIVPESEQTRLIESGLKFPIIAKGEWFETDIFKEIKYNNEIILEGKYNNKLYRIEKNRGLIISENVIDYGWAFAKEYYKDNLNKMGNVFATTEDLTVDEHLTVLKLVAKYTNQAVSKTVNIPNKYNFDDFKNIYLKAWESNIKGLTTYRAGTMSAVLESKNTKVKEYKNILEEMFAEYGEAVIPHDVKLPEKYDLEGHILRHNGHAKYYVNLAFVDSEHKRPFAVFVQTNNRESNEVTTKLIEDIETLCINSGISMDLVEKQKQKCIGQTNVTKMARIFGMALRHNIPMIEIINVLDKYNAEFSTFLFQMKKLLSKYIPDGTVVSEKCPNCGGRLVYQEGCHICLDCGMSRCS